MKYELELFDDIVTNILTPQFFFQKKFSYDEFIDLKNQLKEEKKRFKNSLMLMVFGPIKDKVIERQIQCCQNKLILLANELSARIGGNSIPCIEEIDDSDYLSQLLFTTLHYLMDLLNFIESHFTKYFDQDRIIPFAYHITSTTPLLMKLELLNRLCKAKKLDQRFSETLALPITHFIASPREVSYRQLIYCKCYIDEVLLILNHQTSGIKLQKELIRTLIYLNFNTYAFYSFVCQKITSHYLAKPDFHKQIESLKLFRKLINQAQEKPEFSYKASAESIKVSLSKWITEELEYFSNKRQVTIEFKNTEVLPQKPIEKIQCNLSVAQLAYSLKLLVNAKILNPKSTAELLRFISSSFSTPNTPDISQESLRQKYYSVESTTIEYVLEEIMKLKDQASKDKFNQY